MGPSSFQKLKFKFLIIFGLRLGPLICVFRACIIVYIGYSCAFCGTGIFRYRILVCYVCNSTFQRVIDKQHCDNTQFRFDFTYTWLFIILSFLKLDKIRTVNVLQFHFFCLWIHQHVFIVLLKMIVKAKGQFFGMRKKTTFISDSPYI